MIAVMSDTPLFDALTAYEKRSRGYFRIPGHRFEKGMPVKFTDFAGNNIFKLDVTETPMADDLHNPKGVIAESQQITSEVFGAGKSFYLVNGTTCGNQAMIIAAAGAQKAGKILVPRNAHKSVMAGLIISGATPVYMPVDYIPEIGLTGLLKPETAAGLLKKHPDSMAVFAVSPTYHGFCSDIKALADTAHRHGVPLLVDEAHGAHLYFSKSLPDGALALGADACAQSLHKTAGALTQASLLHLAKVPEGAQPLLDPARVDSALRMTMSTSPSYILMSSLELARNDLQLHGEEYLGRTIELAESIRRRMRPISGFKCLEAESLAAAGITVADPTRLIVNCDQASISGYELKTILWDRFSIDVEMADSRNILLLLSYGNTKEDADNLIDALKSIKTNGHIKPASDTDELPPIPDMILTPRQAYFAKTEIIPWKNMAGRIAAESAAPYPPGIPVLYPGELITDEIFEYLDMMKTDNRHLHGLSDKSLSSVRVCNTDSKE